MWLIITIKVHLSNSFVVIGTTKFKYWSKLAVTTAAIATTATELRCQLQLIIEMQQHYYHIPYFYLKMGKTSDSYDNAAKFWNLRKGRPQGSQADTQPVSGMLMKMEMDKMHQSLLSYMKEVLLKTFAEMCSEVSLLRVSDNQNITTWLDLILLLKELEETLSNVEKLYRIIFQ